MWAGILAKSGKLALKEKLITDMMAQELRVFKVEKDADEIAGPLSSLVDEYTREMVELELVAESVNARFISSLIRLSNLTYTAQRAKETVVNVRTEQKLITNVIKVNKFYVRLFF